MTDAVMFDPNGKKIYYQLPSIQENILLLEAVPDQGKYGHV
jgi:hypothetical protein